MNELTQRGINALKAGDRSTARLLLGAALKQDPNDATAWLWLTGTLNNDEERIDCLQQVLRIDPGNAAAQRGLAQIMERRTKESPRLPVAPPQEVAAPVQPVAEPVQEEAEPAQEVAEPVQEVAQPAKEVSEPVQEVAEPEQEVAEPVQEVAEPVQEVSEPVQEVAEPVQEVAEPVQEVAEPARTVAAVEDTQEMDRARQRRKQLAAAAAGEQVIFRTRPSLVLALMGFWTFLIGAVVVGVLLRDSPVLSLTLGIGLVIFLELIFIFAVMRIMSTRYELTDKTLLLRFRGKRVRVPHGDIYSAECRQSMVQQLLGTGDIHLRAAVKGELTELRISNIPECLERTKQIQSYIKPAK